MKVCTQESTNDQDTNATSFSDETPTLRLTLFKDQMLYVSIDTRSGRFVLRDAGDLAAWERGYRFARYTDRLNDNPAVLLNAIINLRFNVSPICHHVS